jgi:hypothetical protein
MERAGRTPDDVADKNFNKGQAVTRHSPQGKGSEPTPATLFPVEQRRQPKSLLATPATMLPWCLAPASSISLGQREPSPPAMVVAP